MTHFNIDQYRLDIGVSVSATQVFIVSASGVVINQPLTNAGNQTITGALAVGTTSDLTGNVSVGGTLGVTGVATFASRVTAAATLTVALSSGLQLPQTSIAANPSTYTVRFQVIGANGVVYYIPGTTSAS